MPGGRPLAIGFEAHDGCGKTTTVRALAAMLDGEAWFVPDELRVRRDAIIMADDGEEGEDFVEEMIQIYQEEQVAIEAKLSSMKKDVLVIDRTFASFSVEHHVLTGGREDDARISTTWSSRVHQPDVMFQILVPELERQRRIHTRAKAEGKKVKGRELRLEKEPEYRKTLETTRSALGCLTVHTRLRNPRIAALRVIQALMGMKVPPPARLLTESGIEQALAMPIGMGCSACNFTCVNCTEC